MVIGRIRVLLDPRNALGVLAGDFCRLGGWKWTGFDEICGFLMRFIIEAALRGTPHFSLSFTRYFTMDYLSLFDTGIFSRFFTVLLVRPT